MIERLSKLTFIIPFLERQWTSHFGGIFRPSFAASKPCATETTNACTATSQASLSLKAHILLVGRVLLVRLHILNLYYLRCWWNHRLLIDRRIILLVPVSRIWLRVNRFLSHLWLTEALGRLSVSWLWVDLRLLPVRTLTRRLRWKVGRVVWIHN